MVLQATPEATPRRSRQIQKQATYFVWEAAFMEALVNTGKKREETQAMKNFQ